MITPSSASPPGVRDNFDAGSLSWVMGEIREALNRSKAAVDEAVQQDKDAQSTALRHAKTYLHQAHGALQIVDIDGVSIITETTEDLLDRLESGQIALTQDIALVIEHAYQALVEYLEELLSGGSHQPVRLFPYYKSLLEVRGAERIHPADLFFPNLAIRPQLPALDPAQAIASPDYVNLRQRFEKALLPFLKKNDPAGELADARSMRNIVNQVERAQTNQQLRGFWWVMDTFAEAVAAGQVPKELYVKQLFARINLQIRRLGEGSSSIAERLLRDALFFIARVEQPSARAAQVRSAYQLDGVVPFDYDKKRYGQVDVGALAIAKGRLSQAKNLWNRIAAGDASVADAFGSEMKGLTEACSKLGSPPLLKLLRELNGITRHAAANSQPGGSLGLEMATSLLFVENALNNINRLSDDFSEHADALTARLLSIVAGEAPAETAQWLDDMSREAQQRQTMTALASEMQSSLRQVEKTLDDYFRDPAERTALAQIDGILHQIGGALAILDQTDALRAIEHTQAAVRRFVASESNAVSDMHEFQQVAQNIGALSFLIETLQLQPENAKNRFSFDEKQGIFHANLVERSAAGNDANALMVTVPALPDGENVHPAEAVPDPLDIPAVGNELAHHQTESTEPELQFAIESNNPAFDQQLQESLAQIQVDPSLDGQAQAGDAETIELVDHSELVPVFSATPESVAVKNPTESVPALAPVSAPATDEAVDAELLEIFLSEAVEVLACVAQTVPLSRNEPQNQEHLTTLRRSFHTLKGSGRMVGLNTFGAAAWGVEQVLNQRLSDTQGGNADLYALLEKAERLLGAWVTDLQTQGRSDRTADALVRACERVRLGDSFSFEEEAVPAIEQQHDDAGSAITMDAAPEFVAADFAEPGTEIDHTAAAVFELDDLTLDLPQELESLDSLESQQAQEIELSDAEMAAFGIESPSATVAENPQEPAADEEPEIQEPETGTADLPLLVPVADVIDFPSMHVQEMPRDDNVKHIGTLEISVPLHNIYLAETDELVRLLAHDVAEWRHEPERNVNILAVHAAHSLAGSSATVGFKSLQEVAHALEMVLQCLSRKAVLLSNEEFDTLEQSVERLKLMLQVFALGEMPAHEPEQVQILVRMQQEIEARATTAHASQMASASFNSGDLLLSEPGDGADSLPDAMTEDAAITEAEFNAQLDVPQSIEADVREQYAEEKLAAEEYPLAAPPQTTAPIAPVAPVIEPVFVKAADIAADPALAIKDELDADLLPVFLEEGRDMLPEMGEALRAWQKNTLDLGLPQKLLRLLHTIKGSARMAGAMALGQHMHEMESRIEQLMHSSSPSPQAIEDLLARHDHGLHLFEVLQNPEAAKQVPAFAAVDASDEVDESRGLVELQSVMPARTGNFASSALQTSAANAKTAVAAPVPLVRVRADILDRLVNQAGEVSISRSRLETEVGTLRSSLSELTENVSRLRDQLREIEMQAETQITSRMAQSGDREFDPLEFDRFTRLQEITRMMAESVNDVGSVQQNLARTIESAGNDLLTQGRLTRDLQQDLMRVRMVQFASISERLYRVTRQASKELDKRVNLDIRGSAVEVDRSVLEKMAGPFEHLLRNAIVHGIESRDDRRAAGKSEIGELLVEIRQEGNEVMIQFSDDGAGLNLARIRDKATAIGLLSNDVEASEAEISDMIFHPGFSTAETVSELAGRGVGMDVVRSEAAALGGRVAIMSEPGKGAHFTIHLPLTLAVTQVVILSAGGKTYAVPSVLVEQVQQLKTNALASAYNDGAVMWQGQRVPMYYLSGLLGDRDATAVAQQYSPLVIMKSGTDRVALHVDEIAGNREVVVKNIGPQLARLIGIAGATVLGSGEIVLILNPVPLAQRAAHESLRAPRMAASDAPAGMGAVAEMVAHEPDMPKADAVQGLRTQNIIMVVDDSLTVRRVTQRLLTREGYQVVLAKDGVDALEQLQSITPDVMLVDIEMPRMDGFDLTRNVRDDSRTRHIPIIMITSRTATKHRNYAMELGVNEYLGKPYQEDDLLKSIAGFINKETPVT